MAIGKEIFVLACGRFLSATGSGFTAFHAPIYFVNTVGLKPGIIGLGLGAGGLAGIFARIVSGIASDGSLGRRSVIMLAAVILACSSFVLSMATDFTLFVVGAVSMGFGTGLYWPASQAFIADSTEGVALNEAFGINFLCDYIGLSLGVVLGGLLISSGADYRSLFLIDGMS